MPFRPATIALIFILFLVSLVCHADQIILKNGDRITGGITSSDGKNLNVKTDYARDCNDLLLTTGIRVTVGSTKGM